MRKSIIIWLLAIVILPLSSYAKAEIDIGAEVKLTGIYYPEEKKQNEDQFYETRVLGEFSLTTDNFFKTFIQGDFRKDNMDYAQGTINDYAESPERWASNIREAYVRLDTDQARLTFGKQVFDLAMTDEISLIDALNPRDLKDIPRNEKVGIPAISFFIGDEAYIEFIGSWFTPSKLPLAGGRWFRELPAGISLGQAEYDKYSFEYSVYAGIEKESLDIRFGYYNGHSYSPSYRLQPISFTEIELIPVYHRQELYSLGLAKEIFGSIVRSEAGYFNQKDEYTGQELENFYQYVISIDRFISGLLFESDNLYALLQWSDHDNHSEDYIDFRQALRGIMGKLEYNFSDEEHWAIHCQWQYNNYDQDYYLKPSLIFSTDLWDTYSLEVEAGYEHMDGPADSFWGGGGYNKNKSVFTLIKLIF